MHSNDTKLLREILEVLKRSDERLENIECQLYHIEFELTPPDVQSFTIQQEGSMPLTAPDPGNTLQFTATPQPAGAALPAGVVPTWSSSDPLAVVTADPTGLIATVVLDPTIPVGNVVILTITAALPDGTNPTGTAQFTIGAPPPPEVTGFSVAQTA